MKHIKDLIELKYQKNNLFNDQYIFYCEWIFDQWCKGNDILSELKQWDECARTIIVGDIYKTHYDAVEFAFGDEYFENEVSKFILSFYKSEPFERINNCRIYCDESMNLRKVKISQKNKEELRNKSFVLGEIIVPDNVDLADIDDYFPEHKHGEYKFDFFRKDNQMPECLSSDRITRLFDFLLDKDIKIHFNVHNYLYYALTDIVDSIMVCESFDEAWNYKSILYELLMKEYDDLFDTLIKYEFPSIPHGKENDFLIEIKNIYEKSFCKNYKTKNINYVYGLLLLNSLKQFVDELPFIQDNEPYVLEDTLMYEYVQTAVIFINNGIVFDEERKIEDELSKTEIDYLLNLNCKFVNSKSDIGVQLSDAIAGFVSRFVSYVTCLSKEELKEFVNNAKLNKSVEANLNKFYLLYQKSSDLYKYSICCKMSKHEKILFDSFISKLKNI